MTRFQDWSLRRLIRVVVRERALVYLFRLLREEMRLRFYEDNDPTREAYLIEMMELSREPVSLR